MELAASAARRQLFVRLSISVIKRRLPRAPATTLHRTALTVYSLLLVCGWVYCDLYRSLPRTTRKSKVWRNNGSTAVRSVTLFATFDHQKRSTSHVGYLKFLRNLSKLSTNGLEINWLVSGPTKIIIKKRSCCYFYNRKLDKVEWIINLQ